MTSRSTLPELRFLSDNACPNSGPDWLRFNGKHCSSTEGSMTVWGYCSACWGEGRVPKIWAARVDVAVNAEHARLGIA